MRGSSIVGVLMLAVLAGPGASPAQSLGANDGLEVGPDGTMLEVASPTPRPPGARPMYPLFSAPARPRP